jgi:DHA1 family multidrug resistance protein-like MFS transporter
MNKNKIILFFILFFLHSIGINLVHPVTTTYVNSLNLPDYYFGFFFSLMSFGQVIGAIIFGTLSDKIGRKWIIILGILGYGLAQLGFGFINTYPLLILLFRIIAGIFVSAPNTLFISLCLDISTNEKKVKYLSLLSFSSLLGSSLGYEIGGSLYNYANLSISQVFLVQFGFCLTTSLLFTFFMKDVKKTNSTTQNSKKVSFKNLLSLNLVSGILLIALLTLTIGQILISKYLDTYIIHIGYEPATLGHYVLLTGIIGALSNILIIPFVKKINNKNLLYILLSLVLLSSIFTFITFSSQDNIMVFLLSTHLIYCICKSTITPLEQNELSKHYSSEDNGKIMGARQTMLSIGNVLGPLLGSVLYTKGNPFVFIISGFIILTSLVIYIIYFFLINKNKRTIINI